LGDKITIATNYDNANQVQAMVDVLSPATRYPYRKDDLAVSIRHLPWLKEGDTRTSKHVIDTIWNTGMLYDDYKVSEDNVLLCYPSRATEKSQNPR